MQRDFNTDATRIDLASWPRTPLLERFRTYAEPYHGVCLRVDCTETFHHAKQHRLSVFFAFMHRALVAAHQVDNWRTRIVDGEPWQYTTIHGGSAVGRPDETIGFGHYVYHPELATFVREASLIAEQVRVSTDLERHPAQNLIRFSVLPWLDFTSISHATDFTRPDSAPKITFGKITEANGRATMPLSIHVHHALADGLHVAQFVERFESFLGDPERT